MEEWFRAAGAIEVIRGGACPAGVTTHAYGGTRMGDNPETSVVDRWGFSHEVAEPRHSRRIGDGHQRRAESDPHRAGVILANRRLHRQKLEIRLGLTWALTNICNSNDFLAFKSSS